MSDQVKTTDAVKEGNQRANNRLEKASDAPAIRNASKDQVDNAAAQNPIKTKGMTEVAYKDGYVDVPDKRSMELEALDEKGNKVTIDKNSTKRQKDICLDPHPTRLMPAMTEEIEARIKARMEGDKPASKNGNGKEAIADTGTLKAIAGDAGLPQEKRLLAEQYQQMRAASKAHGHGTEVIDRTATEVLGPELKALKARDPQEIYGEYIASNPADDPYAASDSLPVIKAADKPMLQGHVSEPEITNTPEGWLTVAQKIAQLPMDKQLEVIGSGLMAGIEQYQHDERERAWGQLIGTVQGTGEVLQGLAKIADFGAACILGDNERAGKMGEEFGAAIGQTIVGGVRLFQAADQYLYNIGYTGDYAKPFRDVVAAGQKLDEQWSQFPPREQERIKAKLITELLAGGAIGAGGAGTIQKASKFTEILDAVAVEAKALHAAAKPGIKKAVQAVNNAVDELMQPVGDTGMGVKMPIPKDPLKDETKMLMSKADDTDIGPKRPEGGRPREPVPEKFRASPEFVASVKHVLARLSEGEREFLAKHDVAIKPIRQISDKYPKKGNLGACYDPSENTIYVGEKVLRYGEVVPNYDLDFGFRHEFGHAYNAKFDSLGHYVSELPEFRTALKQDIKGISAEKLEELQLDFSTLEELRDEVFADMYAHATGLQSSNPRSVQMKELFPNCLKYAKTRLL